MNKEKIKIKKLSHCYNLPTYKTDGASGMDLYAAISDNIDLLPFERKLIPTGIIIELNPNQEGQIRARSGLSINHGITLINGVGTIDSDYRGEILVPLVNLSDEKYTITRGERIAQLVIVNFIKVDLDVTEEVNLTKRNSDGFGSTGKI